MFSSRRTIAFFAVFGVGAIVAAAVFAFTAANTVPETKAGEGSEQITGYVVSSVHYTLNATDPSKIDAVAFQLDTAAPSGSTIRARLEPAGTWYVCTNTGAAVSCTTTSPQAVLSSSTQLTVAAAQ